MNKIPSCINNKTIEIEDIDTHRVKILFVIIAHQKFIRQYVAGFSILQIVTLIKN